MRSKFVSRVEFSSLNRIGAKLELMSLRAYQDSAGKNEKNSDSRFLTLASLFGTEASWPELERAWVEVLENHQAPTTHDGYRYFHSVEAFHQNNGYQDWGKDRVTRLVSDLLRVIGNASRDDLFSASCSVSLPEYRQVKKEIPTLRKPEQICLDFCMGSVFSHPRSAENKIELFFDRGEKFLRIINPLWDSKDRRRRAWWADRVMQIGPVDMEKNPAVQAADLWAWLANRYWTKGYNDRWGGMLALTFILRPHFHVMLGQKEILELFEPDGRLRAMAIIDVPKIRFTRIGKLMRVG